MGKYRLGVSLQGGRDRASAPFSPHDYGDCVAASSLNKIGHSRLAIMRHFAFHHGYRFPVLGPVHYKQANREGYGTATNVSSFGLRVSGSLPLESGDACSLRVQLPSMKSIVVAGKIPVGSRRRSRD